MFALRLLLAFTLSTPFVAVAQTPAPFAREIQTFAESDARAMPAPGGVLFLGSSSIRMWTDLAKDFPGLNVINRGFGGSQIADSLRYADRLAIRYKPRTIVFYAGDNDIEAGKTPRQVLADYRALVAKVHARLPRTRIYFVSIKPSISRWGKIAEIREANRLVKAFTATDKRLGYVDVMTPMLGPDGMPRPELYLGDGLHMTRAGYDIWRERVAAVLR